jgi:hypothetical protein
VSTSQSFPDAGLQNPGSQVSKSEDDIRTKGDHQIATRDEVEKVLGTDASQGFHSVLPSILGIAPRKPVIEVNGLLGRLPQQTIIPQQMSHPFPYTQSVWHTPDGKLHSPQPCKGNYQDVVKMIPPFFT